jgi:hypothetical protein
MSDEPQFNLDFDPLLLEQELAAAAPSAADAPAEVEPPPTQAAPVVVVQYRNRGLPPILLFPATLILSLGMFASYHVLFVTPRQRELQEQARAAALAASSAVPPAAPKVDVEPDEPFPGANALSLDGQPFFPGFDPSSGVVPVPDAARIVAKPVAPPEPAGKEQEPAGEPAVVKAVAAPVVAGGSAPSPFNELNGGPARLPGDVAEAPAAREAPAPAAPGDAEAKAEPPREVAMSPPPDVPKDVADAPAVDDRPTPTPEEMQRALEAEVEARRAVREEQARMKQQARAQVEAEAQDRVESERSLFRDELKRIVSAGGPTAGQEIDELCDKYGRTYGGELKAQVLGVISRYHGKVARDVEVRLLRSLGVPEAGILDYLAQMIHRTKMNKRNGAHDPDGVRVLAARLLLRMPLLSNPAVGVGAPASPARRRQAPAARGAIAGPAR